MLNIASVNMPKIKPETKVLIIKTLKFKSPAEVADIFNVSKWQVERIRKHYQETGDVHDRPRSGRPRKTTARDDSLLVCLTAPGGVDASDAWFVKNCTSDSCSIWSPWSYCCLETSTKQETTKKPCCVRQGPQSDRKKKDFSVSWAPSQVLPILSMTLRGPSGPTVHPEDSHIWRWKDYGLGLHPIQRCQGDK